MINVSQGFLCPACGGSRTACVDSRPRSDGGIRRRRRCPSCRVRFTTFEVRAEDVGSVLVGVQDASPAVVAQATEVVNILGGLSSDDRILLLGLARRFQGPRKVTDRQREAVQALGSAA